MEVFRRITQPLCMWLVYYSLLLVVNKSIVDRGGRCWFMRFSKSRAARSPRPASRWPSFSLACLGFDFSLILGRQFFFYLFACANLIYPMNLESKYSTNTWILHGRTLRKSPSALRGIQMPNKQISAPSFVPSLQLPKKNRNPIFVVPPFPPRPPPRRSFASR